jgi:ribosomal protein S18 acetylase RimI-like enzyme
MSEPVIRPAVAGDVAAIAAIARAAYEKYVARIGRAPAPMVADFAGLVAAGEVHVLLAGDAPAGFIVIRPGENHLFVENVALHPERQGEGLGRRLLDFAAARARDQGLGALRLYTNVKMSENFPFYAGLGFIETERRHEDGFDRVYFEKRLT